jgi:hypothetical protein
MVEQTNPLSKHFRQPAIYIKLPSKGQHSPQGTVDLGESEELAVYPMTARDEMTMNTPDALMNGQATVDVIKSCVPSIIDPWHLPMMDLDTILIAIRIASFGEAMDMNVNVPEVNEKMEFTTDLRTMMDSIPTTSFNEYLRLNNGLTVRVRPTTYRQLTNLALRTFEEQRMITQLSQKDDMTPAQKSEYYTKVFMNMTNLTIENMLQAIVSINTEGTEVSDANYIKEFVDNMDSKTANEIRQFIDAQSRDIGKVKPLKVKTPLEMVEKGAPAEFEVPVSLDNSNFFVSKSSRSNLLS